MEHDYTPGDEPVSIGTVVDYFGTRRHGRYEIVRHDEPNLLGYPVELLDEYPDGTAYAMWQVGSLRRFNSGHGEFHCNVRRTSFRIAKEEQE